VSTPGHGDAAGQQGGGGPRDSRENHATTGSVVTIPTPDGDMDAFVARPAAAGPFPGVVVIQEAFGVSDHIRDVCGRFAAQGYVALAPELFHRQGRGVEIAYGDMPGAMAGLAGLTNQGLEVDVGAALARLRALPDVTPRRVGVVGFCVGGLAAFIAACRLDPAATVSFYGGGIVRERPKLHFQPVLGDTPRIRAPILCLFGAEDQGIPSADVEAIRAALDRLPVAHEVVVYPGAGHAFFNDMRPNYHAPSAADAWQRTLAWLDTHLWREI
jgi:carboxymethylenebutenolidase